MSGFRLSRDASLTIPIATQTANCTGMYARESAIMDAIKEEIAKYVEKNKDIASGYNRDKAILEEKLAAAKSNFNVSIEQFQHSFEKNFFGKISQEVFKQAITEKRVAEKEMQTIENDIEQLEYKYQKYQFYLPGKVKKGRF